MHVYAHCAQNAECSMQLNCTAKDLNDKKQRSRQMANVTFGFTQPESGTWFTHQSSLACFVLFFNVLTR